MSIGNGAAVFTITNPGVNAWDNMLSQGGINMENGERYRLTITASSTTTRKISVAIANQGGENWYGGGDAELTSAETPYSYEFTMSGATNTNSFIKFSMGVFTTWSGGVPTTHPDDSAASTITIKNVRLEKLEAAAVSETEQSSQESEEGAQEGGESTQGEGAQGEGSGSESSETAEVYTNAVAADNYGEINYEEDLGSTYTLPNGTTDLHGKRLKVVVKVKDITAETNPLLILCVMDSSYVNWSGQGYISAASAEEHTLYFDFNSYYTEHPAATTNPAVFRFRVKEEHEASGSLLNYCIKSVTIEDSVES